MEDCMRFRSLLSLVLSGFLAWQISVTVSQVLHPTVFKTIPYSEALAFIQTDRVDSVLLSEGVLNLSPRFSVEANKDLKSNIVWRTVIAGTPAVLEHSLLKHKVRYEASEERWLSKYWISLVWIGIALFLFFPRLFVKQKGS